MNTVTNPTTEELSKVSISLKGQMDKMKEKMKSDKLHNLLKHNNVQ